MAVGIAVGQANSLLDTWWTTVYVKWHVGDPGVAGTSNAANVTTRASATFSAAASGSKALSNAPTYTATTTETVTHISLWSTVGPAGGTFLGSSQLAASRALTAAQVFTLSTLTAGATILAA